MVPEVDGDEPFPAGLVVLGERRLFHLTGPGGEEQVPVGRELAGVDQGLDVLAHVEGQQVDDRGALGRALLDRHLEGPQPVHLPPVGEEQQVGVGRGVHDPGDQVLLAEFGALHPPAAPALGAELRRRHRLELDLRHCKTLSKSDPSC